MYRGRGICECICECVNTMEYPICRRYGWSGDGLVPVIHGIKDSFSFGVFCDDAIAPVVFEGYANAPSFFAAKVPQVSCRSFLVDHYWAPKWA